MADKLIKLDLGELIDRLSILQIKELLLEGDFSDAISDLEHDIDRVYEEQNIKLSANLIRQIVVMAQANLHVWMLKDEMVTELDENIYNEKLKLAQDFHNGLKNSIKNMMLDLGGEVPDPKLKATFLDPGDWHSNIVDSIGMNNDDI